MIDGLVSQPLNLSCEGLRPAKRILLCLAQNLPCTAQSRRGRQSHQEGLRSACQAGNPRGRRRVPRCKCSRSLGSNTQTST